MNENVWFTYYINAQPQTIEGVAIGFVPDPDHRVVAVVRVTNWNGARMAGDYLTIPVGDLHYRA